MRMDGLGGSGSLSSTTGKVCSVLWVDLSDRIWPRRLLASTSARTHVWSTTLRRSVSRRLVCSASPVCLTYWSTRTDRRAPMSSFSVLLGDTSEILAIHCTNHLYGLRT